MVRREVLGAKNSISTKATLLFANLKWTLRGGETPGRSKFSRIYIETEWTDEASALAAGFLSDGTRLPVLWLHMVEVRNAIELFVFAGKQSGNRAVTSEAAAVAQARFRMDCRRTSGPYQRGIIDMGAWEATAEEITLRHSAKHGFRTYDILHVSAAIELSCDAFYSYNKKCNHLAVLEGLKTPLR